MTTEPKSTTTKLEASEPTLLNCPFCGGNAEKRLTDGPKRGFIGCFTCMIGLPFNAPYGDTEVAAWNARVSANGVPTVVHANESKRDQEAGFLRTIAEGLRHAIRDHGPITSEWIGSASKRVYSRLKGTKYVK